MDTTIDRQVEEIAKEAEKHHESTVRGANNDLQALAKEVGTHCYRQILNGGYFVVPTIHGGNEFKEEQMSEEDKKLERLVRKLVYELTIEEAIEYLRSRVDLTKI